MSLCHIVAILCLTASAVQSQGNCLGPGFTQTIPAQQEWWQYSTTMLKPGDAAVYSSLSFACNGTLQSLTIPTIVRRSIYSYLNQYLYILVSVWRFNETGHYQVREFQGSVKVTEQAVLEVFNPLWNNISIFPQMEVLAKDALAFRLLLPYYTELGLGPVYRHVPFLFKPGPSPGTFIPIVSVNFTASSGPVTDAEGSTLSSANGTDSEDNFSQSKDEADSTQSPANGTENNILQNEGRSYLFVERNYWYSLISHCPRSSNRAVQIVACLSLFAIKYSFI